MSQFLDNIFFHMQFAQKIGWKKALLFVATVWVPNVVDKTRYSFLKRFCRGLRPRRHMRYGVCVPSARRRATMSGEACSGLWLVDAC